MLKKLREMSKESDRLHETIVVRILKFKGIVANKSAPIDERAKAQECLHALKRELRNGEEDK